MPFQRIPTFGLLKGLEALVRVFRPIVATLEPVRSEGDPVDAIDD